MKMNNKGFSLIELMIVVGIIGILATVAVPKFKNFQVKAKISEAKVMLNHIATLEEAYTLESSGYKAVSTTWTGFDPAATFASTQCENTDSKLLGLQILPCDAQVPRFTYNIQASGSDFRVTAYSGTNLFNRVLPGASGALGEKLSMDEKKGISQHCDTLTQKQSDGTTACDGAAIPSLN